MFFDDIIYYIIMHILEVALIYFVKKFRFYSIRFGINIRSSFVLSFFLFSTTINQNLLKSINQNPSFFFFLYVMSILIKTSINQKILMFLFIRSLFLCFCVEIQGYREERDQFKQIESDILNIYLLFIVLYYMFKFSFFIHSLAQF